MSQKPITQLSESEVIDIANQALKSELTVAAIYEKLAKKFKDDEISLKLEEFSHAEQFHANFWTSFLEKRSQNPNDVKVNNIQVNILTFIYGLLGIGLTLKLLEAGERKVIQSYANIFKLESLTSQERTGITRFLLAEIAHEEGLTNYETNFKFFINQISIIFSETSSGLVTVLSAAIGLSGVYNDPFLIGITGLIVGLTGALNTVVGFYFFGRTSRRINEDILERIKTTCNCAPEVYLSRVKKYMLRRNYTEEIAELIAKEAKDKRLIERIIAEEEYGIRGPLPNPRNSALWAGLFKIIGTVLPLSPYFLGFPVSVSILMSILITLVMLSIAGSLVAIAAEVSVQNKIVELVSGGIVLATLTYIIGKSASFLLTYFKIG